MDDSFLTLNFSKKDSFKSSSRSDCILKKKIEFHGFNRDIIEPYHWHINFPLYRGKGYVPVKVEDLHFFSENSQFGAQVRQLKGGSIRAFQENLQQLIQLIKVHMMPLLKEIKKADELKGWMDSIVENDLKYREGLKKGIPKNDRDMIKYSRARDEAINHLKDRWVNEVDGGKLWTISRSQSEGGLDMVLLPQLFFGTKLENPLYMLHGEGDDLATQLDNYTYQIDITNDALQSVARFQYRFYQWLPTAIKETNSTFRIKIAALKQFYSQFKMYMQFMKPLLLEISKKSEGIEKTNMYYGFEENNPDFWNALDFSYSFVRVIGVNTLLRERGGEGMDVFKFSRFGYFIYGKNILWGKYKGVNGVIVSEEILENDSQKYEVYNFRPTPDLSREEVEKLSDEEFEKLEEVKIYKTDLKLFPVMEFAFSQRRRNEVRNTPQGPIQSPFMRNSIEYTGFSWNLFEIATYMLHLKKDDFELLESFIEEVSVMKEDLYYYLGILEGRNKFDPKRYGVKLDVNGENNLNESENSDSGALGFSDLFVEPIKGIYSLINFSSSSTSSMSSYDPQSSPPRISEDQKLHFDIVASAIAEDTWKLYSIFKKAHGFIQY